ncbi:bacterioferritin [Halobacteriovorax marinus]|uniref:Bacterioferritin n=1 Tax=Halobacteriovorax marinus TaxID=97084 RepID=A0A1Y5F4G0_9BACT|nr:bacterioferritin [Halobacteriovorax marinus]
MKGNTKIINVLNELLTGEITAMDIYFLHSRIYQDQGLEKLYTRINHEMQDETNHASLLMERILFLEGEANLSQRKPFKVSNDVKEMIRFELDYELENARELKDAIKLCEAETDFVSRDLLSQLLRDTESDHIYWLEIQLELIEKVGIQNYLQSAS